MALRTVPNQYIPGLAAFIALSDEAAEKLLAAINSASLTLDPNKVLEMSIKQISSLSSEEAVKMTNALFSLYMGVAGSGVATTSFVEDIFASLDTKRGEELKVSDENRERIKERFVALLSVEPLATSTRAVSVRFEHRYTFSKIRVVTDIRPVFGESPEEPPKAAFVAHNLNLHYYDGTDHKEFYVALDTHDIEAMIDNLKRAQSKAKQLESIIERAGLPLIGE